MKILKIVFLTTLITFLFSCNKDDANPTEEVIGEWTVSEIYYEGNTSTIVQGVPPVSGTFVGNGFDMDLKITFEENPNTYSSEGDYSINLETTVSGQTFPSVWSNIEFQGSGTWTKNGTTMVFTNSDGEKSEAEIIEETDSKLKFKQNYYNSDSQNGATITHEVEATFTFEK